MRGSTLLLAIFLASCGDLGFTAEIIGRRPFDPPAAYLDWWVETTSCSEIDGSYARISWFLATSIVGDSRVARARWSQPHDIVIVAGYEATPDVIRHEMLHDLLDGDADHVDSAWERCGLIPE